MLVLQRKQGQEIWIEPGNIRICLVSVDQRNGQVRIGIDAPNSMRILRKELAEANNQKRTEVENGNTPPAVR